MRRSPNGLVLALAAIAVVIALLGFSYSRIQAHRAHVASLKSDADAAQARLTMLSKSRAAISTGMNGLVDRFTHFNDDGVASTGLDGVTVMRGRLQVIRDDHSLPDSIEALDQAAGSDADLHLALSNFRAAYDKLSELVGKYLTLIDALLNQPMLAYGMPSDWGDQQNALGEAAGEQFRETYGRVDSRLASLIDTATIKAGATRSALHAQEQKGLIARILDP